MAINDDDILKTFTRVETIDDAIVLSVECVQWSGSHTPQGRWIAIKRLPLKASAAEVERERRRLLLRRRYFRICSACRTRNPLGWMFGDEDICDACAQKKYGFVH